MELNFEVILEPHELNNLNNRILKTKLLFKLKKKYEKKCTDNGYIKLIKNIKSFSHGEIYDCDLTGNIIFNIVANVELVHHNINDKLKCKIDKIDENGFYISDMTPFIIFIIFDDNTYEKDDFVNVEIKAIKVNHEDNTIHMIADIINNN